MRFLVMCSVIFGSPALVAQQAGLLDEVKSLGTLTFSGAGLGQDSDGKTIPNRLSLLLHYTNSPTAKADLIVLKIVGGKPGDYRNPSLDLELVLREVAQGFDVLEPVKVGENVELKKIGWGYEAEFGYPSEKIQTRSILLSYQRTDGSSGSLHIGAQSTPGYELVIVTATDADKGQAWTAAMHRTQLSRAIGN